MEFKSALPRRKRPGAALHGIVFSRVSIHAPTKGATGDHGAEGAGYRVSIHAPTKGATIAFKHGRVCIIVSIHAPTKGATLQFHL